MAKPTPDELYKFISSLPDRDVDRLAAYSNMFGGGTLGAALYAESIRRKHKTQPQNHLCRNGRPAFWAASDCSVCNANQKEFWRRRSDTIDSHGVRITILEGEFAELKRKVACQETFASGLAPQIRKLFAALDEIRKPKRSTRTKSKPRKL